MCSPLQGLNWSPEPHVGILWTEPCLASGSFKVGTGQWWVLCGIGSHHWLGKHFHLWLMCLCSSSESMCVQIYMKFVERYMGKYIVKFTNPLDWCKIEVLSGLITMLLQWLSLHLAEQKLTVFIGNISVNLKPIVFDISVLMIYKLVSNVQPQCIWYILLPRKCHYIEFC